MPNPALPSHKVFKTSIRNGFDLNFLLKFYNKRRFRRGDLLIALMQHRKKTR